MPHPIPSYRRHRPSGQAVVTLNGKDFYLGPWKSPESLAEYDRLIAEWVSHGRQLPQLARGGELSVAELLVAYLTFARDYYVCEGSQTSEFVGMKDAARPLRDLYARVVVREFGPVALKAVRQRMIDRGLSRREINKRIGRIRRIFKWGVENELVPPSVLHGLQAVAPLKKGRTAARETEPVRPVPDEHVAAVRPYLTRQLAAIVDIQMLSGARSGEVLIMRTGDLDTSGAVWEYVPGHHKGEHLGKERRIYLGPRAQEVVRPWLRPDPAEYLFQPREARLEWDSGRKQKRRSPMTPSQRARRPKPAPKRAPGACYDTRAYAHAVKRACVRAGVPHWHPHRLRHSAATRLRREYGIETARIALGHNSPQITALYAEADREKVRAVMAEAG